MKKFLPGLFLLLFAFTVQAQTYNNEWINFNKTYYKFKIAADGLYRISESTLSANGISTANAEFLQLWRDGIEVPIFTSVSTGPLGSGGYIEFYGTKNNGKLDRELYKDDNLQMHDARSLVSDSAAYFLVLRTSSTNKRLVATPNNLGAASSAETEFNYTLRRTFSTILYQGYSLNLGEPILSSSYESGEGWAGTPIGGGSSYTDNISDLYLSPNATTVKLNATVVGYSLNGRNYSLTVNGRLSGSGNIDAFGIARVKDSMPASTFSTGAAAVTVNNAGQAGVDILLFPQYDLNYMRSFNFGGASIFEFQLPSSTVDRYLEIQNFNYGNQPPVLYDLENGLAITADISSGFVRINLPPVSKAMRLVLINKDPAAIRTVNSLAVRNFTNYNSSASQGDYIIVSHPALYGGAVNNVEKYKEYRASVEGGSFHPIVVDAEQLADQFAYGINHHPLSIRNFANFVVDQFTTPAKYFFFVGKGLTYTEYRGHESSAGPFALVPTFGDPASDNLLTASRTGTVARIPVGRLSAINGTEVGYYLQKVKEYEAAQRSTIHTVAEQAWTKNVAHLTGAIDEPYLASYIESFMDSYEASIRDSLFGAKVYRFSKNIGQNTALGTNKTIDTLFKEGLSFITYFGHSSANNLEFNLDAPNNYNNTGKYPVIMVNGCNTGNLFNYLQLRALNGGSLSEKYIFAEEKGSIGFIATTHFGLLSPLHTFSSEFYREMSATMYGQPLGNIMKATMQQMMTDYPNDYTIRLHAEELTLHGDPAIRVNPHAKPDYITNDSLVTITPGFISLADERYTVKVKVLNVGKAINDSITIRIQHQNANGDIKNISSRTISAPYYETEVQETIALNALQDVGLNKLIITIDQNNKVDELDESNNVVLKQFIVEDDDIRPVYPYNYSIVNNPQVKLFGSTANPLHDVREYVMQMDTTALFNSPLLNFKSVTDSGGVITFTPGMALTDSTVYYWRIGLGPVTASTRWITSSFRFINGTTTGFNQSHFYQFKNDEFSGLNIDNTSRNFVFNNVSHKLRIRSGLHPYYAYDQMNYTVDDNQVEQYGCKFTSLQFLVFDPLTMRPWENYNISTSSARFGSWPVCAGTRKFFEFPYNNQDYRKKAMDFIDSIPNGYYFSVVNLGVSTNTSFINSWMADTTVFGSGQSIYHKLKNCGFTKIDSFYRNRPFIFVGRKGDLAGFPPINSVAATDNEHLVETIFCPGKEVTGSFTTAAMGPAKTWMRFKWAGNAVENTDYQSFDIYGINEGNEIYLGSLDTTRDADISWINAVNYPYLRIKSISTDDLHATPPQIKSLMVTADILPEGAVSPNITFQFPGGVVQDSIIFKTAFRNISDVDFDSLVARLTITDEDGNSTSFYPQNAVNTRLGPLAAHDSITLSYRVPSIYGRSNTMTLDVNPDKDQPEAFHFNNVLSKEFYGIPMQYIFTGSGNWSDASNWKYGDAPPSNLPAGRQIIIDPASGSCILNVPQTISQGAKLTVKAGKRFIVPGNLIIFQ